MPRSNKAPGMGASLPAVALQRYWPLVVALLLVAVGTAIWVNLVTPPVYQSRLEIRIGSVGQVWQPGVTGTSARQGRRLLSRPHHFAERHERDYGRRDGGGAWLDSVHQGRSFDLVDLQARGSSPEQALAFLVKVRDELLAEEHARFEERVKIQQEHLRALQRHRDGIAATLKALNAGSAPDRYAALLAELRQSDEQLARGREQASDFWTYPTEARLQPTLEQEPIQPRARRNLAVALVTGSLFGLLLAIGMQLLRGGGARSDE